MTTDSLLTHWAGEYLKLGLSVIALTGKTPNVTLHKTGLHSALSGAPESDADWAFIARFMEHPDTTGVGILTSYPYVVVDIDGEEGAVQWNELTGDQMEGGGFLTDRWVAKTGRGLHLWFATTVPTGTIKLGPKLDLKGDGGYVVAPPSIHPDTGKPYEWLLAPSAEAPPVEVPEQLARRIEDHAFDLAMTMKRKEVNVAAWGPKYQPGATVFYAQASHDALLEGMLTAAEGNRNNYLHWAAKTLDEEGGTEEEFDQLEGLALQAGLDRVEVQRTLRSARG